MSEWTVQRINNVAELVDVIESWEKKFHDPGMGFPPIWYRGQSNSDWELNPGVLRPDFVRMAQSSALNFTANNDQIHILIRERTINKQFMRMGASFFPPGAQLTEKYFFAQHHGLPTRLLDWTTNPLAALYFAISGSPDKDGAVFVLNPRFLIPKVENCSNTDYPPDVVEAHHPFLAELIGYVCGRELINNKVQPFTLPVTPDLWVGRMLQQGSCFTFQMPNAPPMESLLSESKLEKYIIPKAAKTVMRTILRRMNVTAATLYCDLDHLANEIKSAYGLG